MTFLLFGKVAAFILIAIHMIRAWSVWAAAVYNLAYNWFEPFAHDEPDFD